MSSVLHHVAENPLLDQAPLTGLSDKRWVWLGIS